MRNTSQSAYHIDPAFTPSDLTCRLGARLKTRAVTKQAVTMPSPFLNFVRLVVDGDIDQVAGCLAVSRDLAVTASSVGATRQESSTFFFADIAHYLYAGDTPLHVAAAAFRRQVAALLVAHGADCRARNRRGAEPLHYAADANRWDPGAQAETIEYLISAGGDPNSLDRSGVSPLHRAVRTRSLAAARALVDGGADVNKPNKSGSTPLHLAVQMTGRGRSGSAHAREQQVGIVRFLLGHGARPTDRDKRGRSVYEAATSEWIRTLLRDASAGSHQPVPDARSGSVRGRSTK
jgi:ankyrin repeat protein